MIYQRNLRVMAVELYKITNKLSPEFMWDLVGEIDTKYHTRLSYRLILMRMMKLSKQRSQTAVFIRQKQPRLVFNHSDHLDLRYGPSFQMN